MTEQLDQTVDTETNTEQSNTVLNTAINKVTEQSINTVEVPDKFKVTTEDGSVDYQATLAKMNESYTYLEKKVGTGEVAPKTADEYKIERDGFDFEEFKKDETNNSFLKSAHAQGITNKQLDFLLTEYDRRAVDLVSTSSQLDTDTTVQTLQTEWGQNYEKNIFNAVKAAQASGLTNEQINDPLIGNNVAFIKMASYFGSQMAEDRPVQNGIAVSTDIQSLMRSEAWFDPKHPEHKSVKSQIDSYYNSLRK